MATCNFRTGPSLKWKSTPPAVPRTMCGLPVSPPWTVPWCMWARPVNTGRSAATAFSPPTAVLAVVSTPPIPTTCSWTPACSTTPITWTWNCAATTCGSPPSPARPISVPRRPLWKAWAPDRRCTMKWRCRRCRRALWRPPTTACPVSCMPVPWARWRRTAGCCATPPWPVSRTRTAPPPPPHWRAAKASPPG